MTILEQLRKKNTKIIYAIEDGVFNNYGRILKVDLNESMMKFMEQDADFPEAGNCYIASQKELEIYPLKKWVEDNVYGQVETQVGYCNGNNSQVHGFEFHQCSEVFIAVTDCILALIEPHRPLWKKEYNIDDAHLFYIPKGTMIELYPMVGHFSPLRVHAEGFRSIIILSKGTNAPLPHRNTQVKYDEMMETEAKQEAFALNKWLYVHEDRMDLVDKGAYLYVIGDNSPIKVL
jgi:hypothetical protein